jgi:hypothetical protein
MHELSPTKTIGFILILMGGLLGIVYWGNLAWRNPAKFKELSFFSFLSNDKWFVVYLWSYRILVLVIGLLILLSIVMIILNTVSVTK